MQNIRALAIEAGSAQRIGMIAIGSLHTKRQSEIHVDWALRCVDSRSAEQEQKAKDEARRLHGDWNLVLKGTNVMAEFHDRLYLVRPFRYNA